MKILLIITASFTGLAILSEIALRLTLGLGNPPLYVADSEIGYLLAPNQKMRRFGNLIEINQYSMRNQQLQAKSDKQTRIILLGDSVVNGSSSTDQTETLSSLLEDKLQQDLDAVEVLNISANSWSPRSELAYLERFGLFDTDILVLVINPDDLLAIEPTSLVVGSYDYPEEPPALALIEFYQLFIAAPKSIPELEKLRAKDDRTSHRLLRRPDKRDNDKTTEPVLDSIPLSLCSLSVRPSANGTNVPSSCVSMTLQASLAVGLSAAVTVGKNLAAIKKIKAIAEESDIKFILTLTPLLQDFNHTLQGDQLEARKRLQELVTAEKIHYLDLREVWADFPQPEFLYRDRIHPSPQGNSKIVEAIAEQINK